jgi:hypothetical protein
VVEHATENRGVGSSILPLGTIVVSKRARIGRSWISASESAVRGCRALGSVHDAALRKAPPQATRVSATERRARSARESARLRAVIRLKQGLRPRTPGPNLNCPALACAVGSTNETRLAGNCPRIELLFYNLACAQSYG